MGILDGYFVWSEDLTREIPLVGPFLSGSTAIVGDISGLGPTISPETWAAAYKDTPLYAIGDALNTLTGGSAGQPSDAVKAISAVPWAPGNTDPGFQFPVLNKSLPPLVKDITDPFAWVKKYAAWIAAGVVGLFVVARR